MKTRSTANKYKKHPLGWNVDIHYSEIGGQCGQSCPCCRAEIYNCGIDPDAKWGACTFCLKNKKNE